MLTNKGVMWDWGPQQRKAFESFKTALGTAPLLVYLDPSLPDMIVSDASRNVARGILM